MQNLLNTAPALLVKVQYPLRKTKEKTIGFAKGLNFRVSQGQKEIYTVDSPFPVEIGQGMGPSVVKGSLEIYLPKGQTPETLGLVPYRTLNNNTAEASMAYSAYLNLRIYDRLSSQLIFSCDNVKVGEYSVSIQAKNIVLCTLNFTGLYLTPGQVPSSGSATGQGTSLLGVSLTP